MPSCESSGRGRGKDKEAKSSPLFFTWTWNSTCLFSMWGISGKMRDYAFPCPRGLWGPRWGWDPSPEAMVFLQGLSDPLFPTAWISGDWFIVPRTAHRLQQDPRVCPKLDSRRDSSLAGDEESQAHPGRLFFGREGWAALETPPASLHLRGNSA